MATNYPGSLDDFATTSPAKLSDDDSTGRTHAERHNDVESAVEAIQGELGTDPAGAQATVKARLDAAASAAHKWHAWPSGTYLTNVDGAQISQTGNVSLSADRLYYMAWVSPFSVTLDRIAFEVITGQASANARIGLYAAGSDGAPGSRLADFGEVDCSTTGLKELTISQGVSGGTLYWVAVLNETASVAVRVLSTYSSATTWQTSGSSAQPNGQVYESATYANGLPASAGTVSVSSAQIPHIWLRRT